MADVGKGRMKGTRQYWTKIWEELAQENSKHKTMDEPEKKSKLDLYEKKTQISGST